MKKIKLLAPLFGVATVAATTIPMVSCGDKLGEVIEMKLSTDEEGYFVFQSGALQLKKDKLYTAEADLSKVTKATGAPMMMLSPIFSENVDVAKPTFKRVVVNNQVLKELSESQITQSGWFYFEDLGLALVGPATGFKMSGKVQVSFTLDKDVNDVALRLGNHS